MKENNLWKEEAPDGFQGNVARLLIHFIWTFDVTRKQVQGLKILLENILKETNNLVKDMDNPFWGQHLWKLELLEKDVDIVVFLWGHY